MFTEVQTTPRVRFCEVWLEDSAIIRRLLRLAEYPILNPPPATVLFNGWANVQARLPPQQSRSRWPLGAYLPLQHRMFASTDGHPPAFWQRADG
jgi:hypothetical protein